VQGKIAMTIGDTVVADEDIFDEIGTLYTVGFSKFHSQAQYNCPRDTHRQGYKNKPNHNLSEAQERLDLHEAYSCTNHDGEQQRHHDPLKLQ
jgi:hypothetical protein